MSEAFDGFERQYCQLSANLSKKCSAAALLDGEQKKQKIFEIRAGIEDAENMIRKMDLEARGMQPSVKAVLLTKLREYKSDLNNLKTEVKRLASPNQAARDELLESGMADALAAIYYNAFERAARCTLESLSDEDPGKGPTARV